MNTLSPFQEGRRAYIIENLFRFGEVGVDWSTGKTYGEARRAWNKDHPEYPIKEEKDGRAREKP